MFISLWRSFSFFLVKTSTEKRETCIFHTRVLYICNLIKLYHLYSFRIIFTHFYPSFPFENHWHDRHTMQDGCRFPKKKRKKYTFLHVFELYLYVSFCPSSFLVARVLLNCTFIWILLGMSVCFCLTYTQKRKICCM